MHSYRKCKIIVRHSGIALGHKKGKHWRSKNIS
jgi:hypothetical protein